MIEHIMSSSFVLAISGAAWVMCNKSFVIVRLKGNFWFVLEEIYWMCFAYYSTKLNNWDFYISSVKENSALYYLEKFRKTEFKSRIMTDFNCLSSTWKQRELKLLLHNIEEPNECKWLCGWWHNLNECALMHLMGCGGTPLSGLCESNHFTLLWHPWTLGDCPITCHSFTAFTAFTS